MDRFPPLSPPCNASPSASCTCVPRALGLGGGEPSELFSSSTRTSIRNLSTVLRWRVAAGWRKQMTGQAVEQGKQSNRDKTSLAGGTIILCKGRFS